MRNEYPLYLNGAWTPQTDGCVREDIEPATGKPLFTVHRAGPADVESALASAAAAFPGWAAAMADVRERVLLRAADVMESRAEEFLELLVREGGKAQSIARGEFVGSVNLFRVAAGRMPPPHDGDVPGGQAGADVSGCASSARRHSGNTPVQLSADPLGEKAGVRAGRGQQLHSQAVAAHPGGVPAARRGAARGRSPGGRAQRCPVADESLSAVLAQDKRVRMVSFTGGGNAGRKIAMAAVQDFKRTAMELGGKNPLLVLRDYDLDEAVKIAGLGAFSNQGQLCMATSRILVEEPLYEAFCEKLRDYALSLKVGDPTDPDVFIGPLIDERHCEFVRSQVDDAVAKGAALLCGGTHEGPFFRPTVLCNVDESMRIFYEESFAPVTSVIPVKDADEALAKCNDNVFGLSAAVLTHDLDRAMELGMKIEAGMVHINDLTYLSSTTAPCGGWKESGVGREGGQFSMDDYTELKWLTFQSNRPW